MWVLSSNILWVEHIDVRTQGNVSELSTTIFMDPLGYALCLPEYLMYMKYSQLAQFNDLQMNNKGF